MQSSSQAFCAARGAALCGIFAFIGFSKAAAAWNSSLLTPHADGSLTYNTVGGYRLPDFGFSGYRYGAPLPLQIPRPASVAALVATGDDADRTADIQQAIDAAGRLPIQADGYRGTVFLGAGTYLVRHPIYINKSGIVLSGAGADTVLRRPLIADSTGLAPAKPSPEQTAPVVVIGNLFNIGDDGQPIATWAGGGSSSFGEWRAAAGTPLTGTSMSKEPDATNFRTNAQSIITDARVPVGATTFHISASNAGRYAVGDKICLVNRPTKDWLEAVQHGGMATDSKYYWGSPTNRDTGSLTVRYLREITRLTPSAGRDATVTIDAPIYMDLLRPATLTANNSPCFIYKSNYKAEPDCSGAVTYVTNAKKIGGYTVMVQNCGLQNLLIDIEHQDGVWLRHNKDGSTTERKYETHANDAVKLVRAQDCWVRGVTARGFVHSGVQVGDDATRCTVQKCVARDPYYNLDGGRGYNFGTYKAQLVLFENCLAQGGRHNLVANGFGSDSGIVFRDCQVDEPHEGSEPHLSWITGVLFEGATFTNWGTQSGSNMLDFSCQGHFGGSSNADGTSNQGHGWTSANCVAWRCDFTNQANPTVSGQMFCQKPPTAQNFAIGCKGWITMAQTTRPYGKEPNMEDFRYKSINAKTPRFAQSLNDFYFQRQNGPGHIEPRGGPGTGRDIDHRYTVQEEKYKSGLAFAAVSLTPLTSAAQNAAFDTLEPKSLHEAQRNVANKVYQTESLAISTEDTSATVVAGTYSDNSGMAGTDIKAAPHQTVTFLLPSVLEGTYRVFVGVKGDAATGRFTLEAADSPTAPFAAKPIGAANTYAVLATVSELKVGAYTSASTSSKKFRFTYMPASTPASAGSKGLTLDYIRFQRVY